jgi:acyl carrier protein
MQGNEVVILDDEGNPLPPNEVGEIAIKSPFLAPGYWRQPDLTKAKFLADPTGGDARTYLTGDLGYLKPDGCLIHMGRRDFLVKVRGFRVETGEVESALRGLDKVKDAVVIGTSDDNGETQLTAYVVPNDQSLLTPTALRRLLREKLPDYMIPQTFVLLNALPLTANGKIDRKALPDPGNARPQIETDYVAPRTEMEKRLAQIWAEVLDLSTVGVEDEFVELGGHSLLATRILGKVHEAFGVEVSMRAFLDAATVAGLALVVSALRQSRDKIKVRNPAPAGDEEISEI